MAYAVSAFMAVEFAIPGQLACSNGYLFWMMPKLCAHWPGRPSAPRPWPGAQAVGSDAQSPLVVWFHQLSTAACAATTSSSMPHLQAAQRRISCVVPVNWPSTRTPSSRLARASSELGKKLPPTDWPVTWLNPRFMPLFSASGLASTQAAHSAPDGSGAPGARVPKWAAAEAGWALWAAGADAAGVAVGELPKAEGVAVPVAPVVGAG